MGFSLHTSFCAPSWALKFPELTALSRGCFQHRGKEEFISPLPYRTSLIKHMAWCNIGGGGRGEPGALSVWNKTVVLSLAPKSCWLCCGASPGLRRPWSRLVAKAIFKPFLNGWHSSPLHWVGCCLQHSGLEPAPPPPACTCQPAWIWKVVPPGDILSSPSPLFFSLQETCFKLPQDEASTF